MSTDVDDSQASHFKMIGLQKNLETLRIGFCGYKTHSVVFLIFEKKSCSIGNYYSLKWGYSGSRASKDIESWILKVKILEERYIEFLCIAQDEPFGSQKKFPEEKIIEAFFF